MKFWSGGKKRFFILRGNSIVYMKDHRNMQDSLATYSCREVLLTAESVVGASGDKNPLHTSGGCLFHISGDSRMLQLVAADEKERDEWIHAITMVINQIKKTTRGYLKKRNAGVPFDAMT
ncbi:unnamed protein product, partial [Chrysoparadoxa australica]